ncbi:ABC transporter permease [Microvirga sp. TS319]|uniref:ABC transporter permease n=1 Tax=Microvirga sp. TS319 TaxID=3241165 RepID=UPI00351A4D13
MRNDPVPFQSFAPIVIVGLCVLILEGVMRLSLVSPLIVAAPSQVVGSFPLLWDEHIGLRFLQTFAETLLATTLAMTIGGPIGWLLARNAKLDLAFRGWVAVASSAPLILMYPLFLVAFGRNMGTVVAIGAVSALAPIILKTRDGLTEVKTVLIEVGRSYGLSEQKLFRMIMLPAAAPSIINGLRLAIIFALANVVAVEFIINYGGIGYLVGEMADRYEIPGMYGAILAVITVSTLFYYVTERIERCLRPF